MISQFKALFVLLLLALSGCTSPGRREALHFPSSGDTEFIDTHGRKWIFPPKRSEPVTGREMVFLPEGTDLKSWKEKIIFGFSKEDPSPSIVETLLNKTKAMDPDFISSYEVAGKTAVLILKSKRFNERGISKRLIVEGGYYYVAYSERLGEAGNDKYRYWATVISDLPMEAIVPSEDWRKSPVSH